MNTDEPENTDDMTDESPETDVTRQTLYYLGRANQFVRDSPWPSIGIAAGVGFLVGALLASGALSRRD